MVTDDKMRQVKVGADFHTFISTTSLMIVTEDDLGQVKIGEHFHNISTASLVMAAKDEMRQEKSGTYAVLHVALALRSVFLGFGL